MTLNERMKYKPKHAAKPKPKQRSAGRELVEWILTLGFAVALALVVHNWVAENVIVSGTSMVPTLADSEKVLMARVEYYFTMPKRGDIVIVKYPDRTENIIKRVVAVPGETISVSEGMVFINGKKLEEPYIKEKIHYVMEPVTVPAGTVFVMGDNRNDSTDSHMPDIGPIPLSKVLGRAYAVVWPLKDVKKLSGYTGKLE